MQPGQDHIHDGIGPQELAILSDLGLPIREQFGTLGTTPSQLPLTDLERSILDLAMTQYRAEGAATPSTGGRGTILSKVEKVMIGYWEGRAETHWPGS